MEKLHITGGSSGIGLWTGKTLLSKKALTSFITAPPIGTHKAKSIIGKSVSTVQGDVSKLEDSIACGCCEERKKVLLTSSLRAPARRNGHSLATTPGFYKTFGINARGTFLHVQKALRFFA